MNIYTGFDHNFGRAVVTVGSFDGVHSGHRKLIELLNTEADKRGCEAVVITFDPHPRQVLRGTNRLLSSRAEKLELLRMAGARNVVIVEFTREFAAIEAHEFAVDYLKKGLGAVAMMVGEDHSFGRGGNGNDNELQSSGIEVIHLGRFDSISSTMVREAMESGDMEKIEELLGAPYMVLTPVTDKTKILPPEGTYLCERNNEECQLTMSEILKEQNECRIFIKKSLYLHNN